MTITRMLYRAARASNNARSVRRSIQTGDPRYVERRAANVIKGRVLGKILNRTGFWR